MSQHDDYDYDYDDLNEAEVCPRCDGDGEVNCYCGGDLCVCENYGERACPRCHGEGYVAPRPAARAPE